MTDHGDDVSGLNIVRIHPPMSTFASGHTSPPWRKALLYVITNTLLRTVGAPVIGLLLDCGIGLLLDCGIGLLLDCGIGLLLDCSIGLLLDCGSGLLLDCGIGLP